MSVELKGKLTAKGNLNGKIGVGGVAGTDNYPDLNNLPQINGVTLIDNKTSEELGINIPTKTSDLENDSGFVTAEDIPTKTSDLQNDSGFITDSDLPTKVSDLENDTGFITSEDLPTKVSDLENDSGFVTSSDIPTKVSELENDSNYATRSELPTNTSDLYNDSGFITSSALPTKTSDLYNDSGYVTMPDVILGIIDDTQSDDDSTYSSDKIEAIIDALLPIDEASGAIATFSTDLAKPLVSLKADINAVQASGTPTPSTPIAISGWSDVSLAQRGNNLWDEVWELGSIDNQTGQNTDNINTYRSKNYIQIPKGENLYLVNGNSDTIGLRFYDSNKNFIGSRAFLTSKVMTYGTYDLLAGTMYIRLVNTSTNVYLNNISINYPSTLTTYEAYNGNTEVINLGDTIYGGYVTKDDSGTKLVITHSGLVSLGSFSWNTATSEGYSQSPSDISGMLKTASGSTIPDMFCTSLKVDTPTNVYNRVNDNSVSIASANSRLRCFMSSIAGYTNTQIQGVLSDVYIAYPLAEPIEIPLSDIPPFTTFIGTNNIFADSGDIEVKYKESIQKYIDDKIAETQALIL